MFFPDEAFSCHRFINFCFIILPFFYILNRLRALDLIIGRGIKNEKKLY